MGFTCEFAIPGTPSRHSRLCGKPARRFGPYGGPDDAGETLTYDLCRQHETWLHVIGLPRRLQAGDDQT